MRPEPLMIPEHLLPWGAFSVCPWPVELVDLGVQRLHVVRHQIRKRRPGGQAAKDALMSVEKDTTKNDAWGGSNSNWIKPVEFSQNITQKGAFYVELIRYLVRKGSNYGSGRS